MTTFDVGIRDLKARLSEYLDRAADGDTIRVTDRGRPKAVLGPVGGTDRVEQGIKEGWIAAGPAFGEPARVPKAFKPRAGVNIVDVIDQDRGS